MKKKSIYSDVTTKLWNICNAHWSDGNGGYNCGSDYRWTTQDFLNEAEKSGLQTTDISCQIMIYKYLRKVREKGYPAGGHGHKPTYYEIADPNDLYTQLLVTCSRMPELIGRFKVFNTNVQNANDNLQLPNTEKHLKALENMSVRMQKLMEGHKKDNQNEKVESN